MKILKLSIIILGFLLSPSLIHAASDFRGTPEAREFFESLQMIGETDFSGHTYSLIRELSYTQDLTKRESIWVEFLNKFYFPTLDQHREQVRLYNRYLHAKLMKQGLGPWFLQNIVSSASNEGLKESIKKNISLSLSFDVPVGSKTSNEFIQYASVEDAEYFDVWKQAFQKTLSLAPQAIQLDKESVQTWREARILDWLNSQKDTKGRNLANLLAFREIQDFSSWSGPSLLSELVRDNSQLLLEADQNGRCAILALAEEWLRDGRRGFAVSLVGEKDQGDKEDEDVKIFDYLAHAPWTAELVEQVKTATFGPHRISLGDYLVTCYQGWGSPEIGFQDIDHSIPKRHPELLVFTTDEFGFGVVNRGKYFSNKTDKIGISPNLWRSIATSKYSLRFGEEPRMFLDVALQTASSKGERYVYEDDYDYDYVLGARKTIPADPLYDVFWHSRWTTTAYNSQAKAQAVQIWESLINHYENFGRELSHNRGWNQIEFQEGTSLGMKALQIVNQTNIDSRERGEDFRTAVVGNGGIFSIDFCRSPNQCEWAIYKETFGIVARGAIGYKHLSNDEDLASIYDTLKEKLFDISYGSTLNTAEAEIFLDHKCNSFIAATSGVARSAANQRAQEAAAAADSTGGGFAGFRMTQAELEDADFDKIGSYIGLAGPAVKSRYQWMESQWGEQD